MRLSGQELEKLWQQQTVTPAYPPDIATGDRITGAILGVLIGDALGLGRLWYYEYDELWDYGGGWQTDYCDPKNRDDGCVFDNVAIYCHQQGLRAGFNSQTGQLVQMLLEQIALAKEPGWDSQAYIGLVNDFFRKELLPSLDNPYCYSSVNEHFLKKMSDEHLGRPGGLQSFSGRYSGEMVRHAFDRWYHNGKQDGVWWQNRLQPELNPGTDVALLGVVLAGLYRDPQQLFREACRLCSFWLDDKAFASRNIIYIMTVQAILNGVPLQELCDYLIDLFTPMGEIGKTLASYDDVGAIAHTLRLIEKPQLLTMDDRFMPMLLGMDCHLYHLLPGAYYYACKYCTAPELGLLYAANSGGNNMARGALTGGLLGAMNGIAAFPTRWLQGLDNFAGDIPAAYATQSAYLLDLANKLKAKSK